MQSFIDNLFNLENKNIIILGGSGHLCSEFCEAFIRCGSNVFILDKSSKKNKSLIRKLKDLSENNNQIIKSYVLDTTKRSQQFKVYKNIKTKIKKIDVLINGAGINNASDFLNIKLQDWHHVINSHLQSAFISCQLFGKDMIKQKSGSIINISSMSSTPPLSKAFAYSVAKSGLSNLTKNLSREWGKFNVRVNALRPGFFPTKWNTKNFIDNKRKNNIFNHTPMKRFGNPKELVGAVIWLASDSSKFVTGSEITVDGGFSAQSI